MNSAMTAMKEEKVISRTQMVHHPQFFLFTLLKYEGYTSLLKFSHYGETSVKKDPPNKGDLKGSAP